MVRRIELLYCHSATVMIQLEGNNQRSAMRSQAYAIILAQSLSIKSSAASPPAAVSPAPPHSSLDHRQPQRQRSS